LGRGCPVGALAPQYLQCVSGIGKLCIDLAGQYCIGVDRAVVIFNETAKTVCRWPEFAGHAGLAGDVIKQIGRFHRGQLS